ncbi:hypothetical protein ACCC92_24255 [Mucilaginibacter sp. Mucisp84]|uniref:hypothetical protein n=1 Tax=Mucilaginibacter sp. Mucisp84 TaxID=3243058 RepID=UPI0039A68C15
MDKREEQIRANLKRIAGEHAPDFLFDGTVVSIDAENYLVDVELDTGGVLYECRLRTLATGNKSIDVLPKEGSAVVIAKVTEGDYLVLCADEITNYQITIGTAIFNITEEGTLIKKGDETLKAVLNEMVDQMLKIYAPKDVAGITAIKERLNNLLK